MARIGERVDLMRAAGAGIVAGLCLTGFEMMATVWSGAGSAATPLRMAAGTILGRQALDPAYSLGAASVAGTAVIVLLSAALAILFAAVVSWIVDVTEHEVLTRSLDMVVAGVVFGVLIWLVGFYVVAPLAGWRWFPESAHHTIAFIGYGIFFGGVLGAELGRFRKALLRRA